ncbi:cell surface protein [Peptacetobacter hominis]|uniref:Cell surface protein n=1 Tax=Peptacetobacter hominis TaxID=2743610 RepID=A0A544QTD3_9FIRM|nr:family 10 glycosylhydrolase [Peptacetobacter hominis]TQQ83956.1 cell surface protein [Peptacetobacter hominis]
MKNKIARLISVMMAITFVMVSSIYTNGVDAAENEMRAAWVSTVYNLDWPKTKNNASKQKQELTQMMDKLKGCGINTIILQVRPESDALYKSSINPWSKYLTGTQGKDPGYDPLSYAVSEAHKRGMEIHAWFNPYRVTTSGTDLSALASSNPARKNPSWVIKYNNKLYYDPGNPAVIDYLVKTVTEVAKNYDVDGVHFDDYFYPSSSFPDDATYKKYGNGMSKADWRRENVNTLLREVKSSVKSVNPDCQFGVSPFGIWRNKSDSCPTGSDTKGSESYSSMYADSRTWIRKGYIDYIAPQLYWPMGYSVADYTKLVKWWANEVKGYNVKLYIGQGIYKQGQSDYSGQNIAKEIKKQINENRKYDTVSGSIYFSAKDILNKSQIYNDLKSMYGEYTGGFDSSDTTESSVKVTSMIGANRYDTAARISKAGWSSGSSKVIIANGLNEMEGIISNPLAASYNAPILLVSDNAVRSETETELKRLNPSEVIIVGGTSSVKSNIESKIKSIVPKASVRRINASGEINLSVAIAKEIDKVSPVNKIYMTGTDGEADALSVAAKAGEEKAPILVTDKNSLSSSVSTWIKDNNISDAYFLGQNMVISDSVIKSADSIISGSVSGNRIGGANRNETNALVIDKFYKTSDYNSIIVTKNRPLADAITSGVYASKLKVPIVLAGNELDDKQESVLSSKKSPLIYRIGGGITSSTFNKIQKLME